MEEIMAIKEVLCPRCESRTYKAGISNGNQRYKCRNKECGKAFQENYINRGFEPGIEDKALNLLEENNSMRGGVDAGNDEAAGARSANLVGGFSEAQGEWVDS